MKPSNSPTQGQPQPKKKIRLKSGLWATFFPTANNFSWVGIVFFCRKQTARNVTQPNSPQSPLCLSSWTPRSDAFGASIAPSEVRGLRFRVLPASSNPGEVAVASGTGESCVRAEATYFIKPRHMIRGGDVGGFCGVFGLSLIHI